MVATITGLALLAPVSANADMFGADVAVLGQILSENIRHYYQLQQMISQGQKADQYLRWINQGLDNSIGLMQSLPIQDEHILTELRDFRSAMGKVENLYGKIPQSPEQALQVLHDESVAESLKMASESKAFSETQERNAAVIATESRDASPKGAARMLAETSSQILASLSQLIRVNTQMLKLQSEDLAMRNKGSKDGVSNYQKISADLGSGFSKFNPEMKLSRF